MNKTIAVDFDGVIHRYSKDWQDGSIYDIPNKDCFQSLQELFDNGYDIVLYTCRANNEYTANAMVEWMAMQMRNTRTTFNYSYTSNKPVALIYIDDRGLRFENWKKTMKFIRRYL